MLRPESLTAHQRQTQKISVQRSDRHTRMTSACLLPPRLSATRDSQQREYRNYLCWKCRFNKYLYIVVPKRCIIISRKFGKDTLVHTAKRLFPPKVELR